MKPISDSRTFCSHLTEVQLQSAHVNYIVGYVISGLVFVSQSLSAHVICIGGLRPLIQKWTRFRDLKYIHFFGPKFGLTTAQYGHKLPVFVNLSVT